jgi:hypothetical protein
VPYAQLVEPGMPSPDRVSFHVPAGTPERQVAQAGYPVLREQDPLELVVDGWFAGIMTMAKVLPLLLTIDNTVRGQRTRSSGHSGTQMVAGEATRVRCPVCGAIAYVLGPGAVRCRVDGHGTMVPLSR